MVKYRIQHFPQIPCKPFIVLCETLDEAKRASDVLSRYDLFLLKNRHRVDYASTSIIQYYDTEERDWIDYDPAEWRDEG